jgi:hypothetical protein
MATRTPNLSLQKPGKGEFRDTWHVPLNSNSDVLDLEIGNIQTELQNARFSQGDLATFLAISINSDGTLKPTSEVMKARNSYLYGNKLNADPYTPYDINDINILRDKELWAARGGQADLRAGMAFAPSFGLSKVLTGTKNLTTGAPAWISVAGTKIGIDGTANLLWMEISGRLARCRTKKEVTVPTTDGWYFLYADYNGSGVETFSGSGSSVSCSADIITGDVRIHRDAGKDYTGEDVKIGDVLRYTAPTTVAGDYLIEMVAPVDQTEPHGETLRIKGIFPLTQSSITYSIIDPLAVTLGTSSAEVPTANRIYLAEFYVSGGVVDTDKIFTRHFGDTYVGDWRAVDVTTITSFTETWNHQLGSDKLDVVVQVRQDTGYDTNDITTGGIEELSLAKLTAALTGTVGGSLTGSTTGAIAGSPSVTLSSGDQTVTATSAGTLGFTSTAEQAFLPNNGSLAVSATPINSVIMKYNRNQIMVKNAVAGLFYTDFGNTERKTGFIRVIISKRG